MLFPGVVGKLGPPLSQAAQPIPPRPLPEGIEFVDGSKYKWGDHTVERLQLRGVHVYEVLAALEYPDYCSPSKIHDDCEQRFRGDIKVVVNKRTNKLVTVIALNGDDHPRTPLAHAGAPMNIAAAINAETRDKLLNIGALETPPAPTPPVEKGRLFVRTGLAGFVEQYVRGLPPGTFFAARDIYDQMPAEMKAHQTSPKSGVGSIASNLSPGGPMARQGLVVKATDRVGYQKPYPVDTSIPEQDTQRKKTSRIIEEAEALADSMEAVENAPEDAVEPVKPSAIEMFYGDDIKNRRAVYGRLHEVVGMLVDLGWAYEFSQNNKTFTLQGEWPPK